MEAELLDAVDEYLAAVDELQTHSVCMLRDVGGQLPSVDELSRARQASQLVVLRRQDLRRVRNRLLASRDVGQQTVDLTWGGNPPPSDVSQHVPVVA